MGNSNSLDQILEYLKEVGPYVLAAPEDANFFRKIGHAHGHGHGHERQAPAPPIAPPVPVLKAPELKPAPAVVPVSVPVPMPDSSIGKTSTPKPAPAVVPVPMPVPLPDSSIRNILAVAAPELAILNDIPSDAIAKKIAERWKTKNQSAPISILCYQEPPEQRALLEQIAKALDIYFGPAKIVQAEAIEKEKQWEAFLSVADLKMVIVCDYTLWQLNALMHFYKETPAQGTRMLGNVSLFLLPDLSLYLKDPLLKRSLWKALCQKFS